MATTVTRSNYWMLKLTSDTASTYNFKFVVDIWVDGAKFIRLKQPKNNSGSAHINFEKIVKNYIKVTNKHDNTPVNNFYNEQYDSIHLIPFNQTVPAGISASVYDYPISKNTDTLKTFTFKFYEEYSTTANGTVSVHDNGTDDEVYPLINYANEWEDKMELDYNKVSFDDKFPSLIPNPEFTQHGTANEYWNTGTGNPISFDEANDLLVMNALTTSSTIITKTNVPTQEKNQDYYVSYNIQSVDAGITVLQYWDGSGYKTIPHTNGQQEFKFTSKRSYRFYFRVYGSNGALIKFKNIYIFKIRELANFLTDLPAFNTNVNSTSGLVPHITSFDDHKTFAFFNDDEAPISTRSGIVEYKFFAEPPIFETLTRSNLRPNKVARNYLFKIEVDNDSYFGGVEPSSATSDDDKLLYVGVGGANVKNLRYPTKGGGFIDELSANQMGVKYYTVQYISENPICHGDLDYVSAIKKGDRVYINAVGDTDWSSYVGEWIVNTDPNNPSVGDQFFSKSGDVQGTGRCYVIYRMPVSKPYLFEIASDINCNSTRFDEYSLAWKNKYGTWDYYMFDGEHSDVRNYKREDQSQKVAGSWGASDFAIESYERGKVQKVGGTKQTTINTRFITDDYNDYFNGLLMSNEVLLLPKIKSDYSNVYDAAIPINIKDTSLAYKTNLKDKLVQYSFTFEYAHDLKQRV